MLLAEIGCQRHKTVIKEICLTRILIYMGSASPSTSQLSPEYPHTLHSVPVETCTQTSLGETRKFFRKMGSGCKEAPQEDIKFLHGCILEIVPV